MTGSDHSDKEFRETRNLYVSMMSLYELADKLFGATYVAFMRAQDLSIAQISNLFSIQQILQAVFDYPTGTISDKIGRKKIMGYTMTTTWAITSWSRVSCRTITASRTPTKALTMIWMRMPAPAPRTSPRSSLIPSTIDRIDRVYRVSY